MVKNCIFMLVLAVLLSTCTASQSMSVQSVSLTSIEHPLSADSIFNSNCCVVKFQNVNQESAITDLDKLLCTENRFFVVDRKGNKLIAFDKNGRFIKSTASLIGKSKNEYISIFDATLDNTEKKIYAYCDAPSKLMIFDYNLNVIENVDFQTFTWELSVDDHYLYSLSPDLENGTIMKLLCFDKKNLFLPAKEILSTRSAVPELSTNGKSIIHCGDCFFAMPFEQFIYRIKDGAIVDSYQIEFGNLWFDENNVKVSVSDFLRINRDKHWMITNICPSDSKILFNTNKYHTFILDLKTKLCYSFLGVVDNYIPMLSRVIPTEGLYGNVVYKIDMEKLKDNLRQIIKENTNEDHSDLVRLALEYQYEDNPTICIWEIK